VVVVKDADPDRRFFELHVGGAIAAKQGQAAGVAAIAARWDLTVGRQVTTIVVP
jgi:hypothetical protein